MTQCANTQMPNDFRLSLFFCTVQFVERDRLLESFDCQPVGRYDVSADSWSAGNTGMLRPVATSLQAIFISNHAEGISEKLHRTKTPWK